MESKSPFLQEKKMQDTFQDHFQKLVQKLPNHPRMEGYEDNMSAINKMIDDGIWYNLIYDDARPYFKQLSKIYNVKRTNFYTWQNKLKENIHYLPTHSKNPSYSRVFTPSQFQVIEQIIDQLCDSHNIPITNILIKELLRCYYHNLVYKQQPNLQFNCSDHFITNLKQILSYSTRASHLKRRPTASTDSINKFKQRCSYVFQHADGDHIVNSDESFFRCMQLNDKTWAKKGVSDVIINSNTDDKVGFTFLGTICYDGTKFPLVLISKGSTLRSEKSWFGPKHHIADSTNESDEVNNPLYKLTGDESQPSTIKPNYLTDHSLKGWTNTCTWIDFLKRLRYTFIPINPKYEFYNRKNRIYLISDSYGSHDCSESETYATTLNIDIITIPKGLTDKYQPLDIRINGIVKKEQKGFMNKVAVHQILDIFDSEKGQFKDQILPLKETSRKEAAEVLYCIWQNISSFDIKTAFDESICEYFEDVSNDDDFSEDAEFEEKLRELQADPNFHPPPDSQSSSEKSQDVEEQVIPKKTLTRRERIMKSCEERAKRMKRKTKIYKSSTLDEILIVLLTPSNDNGTRIWKTTKQLIDECRDHTNAPGNFKEIPIERRVKANLLSLSYLQEVEYDEKTQKWSLKKKSDRLCKLRKRVQKKISIDKQEIQKLDIKQIVDDYFHFE